jgi:hypothetical protein
MSTQRRVKIPSITKAVGLIATVLLLQGSDNSSLLVQAQWHQQRGFGGGQRGFGGGGHQR